MTFCPESGAFIGNGATNLKLCGEPAFARRLHFHGLEHMTELFHAAGWKTAAQFAHCCGGNADEISNRQLEKVIARNFSFGWWQDLDWDSYQLEFLAGVHALWVECSQMWIQDLKHRHKPDHVEVFGDAETQSRRETFRIQHQHTLLDVMAKDLEPCWATEDLLWEFFAEDRLMEYIAPRPLLHTHAGTAQR